MRKDFAKAFVVVLVASVAGCGSRESAQEAYLRESATLEALRSEFQRHNDYVGQLIDNELAAKLDGDDEQAAKIKADEGKTKPRTKELWTAIQAQKKRVDAARAAMAAGGE